MTVDQLTHEALFYRSTADLLAGTVPFVRDGLAAGEPVLVATPLGNAGHLRDELGRDAQRVRFADITVAGRNPSRIIPFVLHAFAAEHGARRVRMIGEPIWLGRSTVEYPACAQHETLVNVAFAGRDASILCLYDAAGLDEQAVADAAYTHPVLIEAGRRAASAAYGPPHAIVERFNLPLPAPPPGAVMVAFDGGGLAMVRSAAAEFAGRAGLVGDQVGEFVLAINEIAGNSIRHGGGSGRAWLWSEDGVLVAQVSDRGRMTNLLAGRLPPPPDTPGGLGLLLAGQLCDLVRLHTGPEGTTVRLHVAAARRDPADPGASPPPGRRVSAGSSRQRPRHRV